MNSKFNFTKEAIQGLPTMAKPYSVFDIKTPNLRLVIYPSGVKTFMLCRKVNSVWQRIKVGRFTDLTVDQARKEALRLNSLIGLGQDPYAEKQALKNEITFRELFEYYYNEYAIHFTKRAEENRKAIEFYVLPIFGKMRASEITTERLRKFHTKLAEVKAKSTANRAIAIMSPVFNYCIENSYYKGINPCIGVKKFRTFSRDRFLSQKELTNFFDAIEKESDLFKHFFLMLLYTGARKSNVLSMKWADIDFQINRWRISESETKNNEVNVIPLCAEAIEILLIRLNVNKFSLFVFPGEGAGGYLHDPKKAFNRIRKRMGVSNFRMHDLRRTLGSYMAISGASLPIIGSALNHKSQVSTAIYARLSQAPVLEAISTAVALIKGGGIETLFKENKEPFQVKTGAFHFSALI